MRWTAVCLLSLAAACAQLETPTSASPLAIPKGPSVAPAGVPNFWGHGMTVSTDDGGIAYVCETQPRQYGDGLWIIDHYVTRDACPLVRIE